MAAFLGMTMMTGNAFAQVSYQHVRNATGKLAYNDTVFLIDPMLAEKGRYEGFGPNGSMIIVDTLTSNVNRTAANVRSAYGKNGGNMGASGSVSYLFDKKGVIVFAGEDADSIFEQLLEADVDVDDVEADEGTITVYTAPADLHKGIEALRANGVEEFQVTELEMIPQSEVTLEGDDLDTFEKLIDALEADDDVQKVYHNVEGM